MKRLLLFAAWGFVLGEVYLRLPMVWQILTLVFLCSGGMVLWMKWNKSGRNLVVWMMPFFFMLFGVVRLWQEQRQVEMWEKFMETCEGEEREIYGKIIAIQPGKENWRLDLEGEKPYPKLVVYVKAEEMAEEAESQAAVVEKYGIGERICVIGEMKRFRHPGNPGEFDYAAYYHAQGYGGQMYGEVVRKAGGSVSPYFQGIYSLKRRAADILERICEKEDLGIFQSVVLGDKSSLEEDTRKLYQRNGISHLLAVSGLHISMISLTVYGFFRKLGLSIGQAGIGAGFLTISYGILSGNSASAIRAVVMVCLRLTADRFGRTYDLLSAMAVAALLLLVKFPLLLFQASFQLSFGAIVGIGVVLPVLQAWVEVGRTGAGHTVKIKGIEGKQRREKRWKGIGNAVLSGLAIQIVTFPVIAYHFFEYPVYSMLLNLLVIPFMGGVLISGILCVAVGGCSLLCGRVAIGGGHYVLVLYRILCESFQKLPGAVWVLGRPKMWQIGAYVCLWGVVLGVKWLLLEKEDEEEGLQKWKSGSITGQAIGLVMICVVSALFLAPRPLHGLQTTFLDVGQGDGIFFRTRHGVILLDGGSTDQKKLGQQVLEPYLKSNGISKVSYAIVSHGDQDHISGLSYLLESDSGIQIQNLILPIRGKEDPIYEKLGQQARNAGAKVFWMKQGDQIRVDGLSLRCLYDGTGTDETERNNHSLLIQASYGDFGMLLTGDMSADGELQWLEQKDTLEKPVQILKIAHHGSGYSSTEPFLKEVSPKLAVISCGEGNRYGHPHVETLERLEKEGIPWVCTRDCGAVLVGIKKRNVQVRTYKK